MFFIKGRFLCCTRLNVVYFSIPYSSNKMQQKISIFTFSESPLIVFFFGIFLQDTSYNGIFCDNWSINIYRNTSTTGRHEACFNSGSECSPVPAQLSHLKLLLPRHITTPVLAVQRLYLKMPLDIHMIWIFTCGYPETPLFPCDILY